MSYRSVVSAITNARFMLRIYDTRGTEESMRVFLAVSFLLASAFPAWGQTADAFVKVDSEHCWVDAREVVHRLARDVTEDEGQKLLRAGHFSTMGGDSFYAIRALPEKNKKGEEGCRIYVAIEGAGTLSGKRIGSGASAQASNDLASNFRLANKIAAEVESMEKARVKKEKKTANP
jgi:hypothetical protein